MPEEKSKVGKSCRSQVTMLHRLREVLPEGDKRVSPAAI